jgi:hypothetical protein
MKAVDTLHISSVKPDSLQPGEEFEVAGYVAEDLEARGLAERVSDKPAQTEAPASDPEAKAEPAPENKMEAAPENKASTTRKRKLN